jgi:Mg/Co/Ni transporter MgtE
LSASGLGLVKMAMTDYKSPDKHLQALIQNREALEKTIEVFRSLSLDSVKRLFAAASDGRIEELFNEHSPLDRQEGPDKIGPIDAIYSIYL